MTGMKKTATVLLMIFVLMSMMFTSSGMFSSSYAEDNAVPSAAPAAPEDEEQLQHDPAKGSLSVKAAKHVTSAVEFYEAVENASENDEVILDSNIIFDDTYQTANYIYIGGKTITIKSSGPEKYQLDLNNMFYAIYVYGGSKCTFENVEITGSKYRGIWGAGEATEITLTDAAVTGCPDTGVYADGIKALTAGGSEISGCGTSESLRYGGGIYASNADTLLIENSRIHGCGILDDKSVGGGVYTDKVDTLLIENSSIYDNKAKFGAGIRFSEGNVTIKGSDISDNNASDAGGAMYANSSTLTMEDTVINGNTAVKNGGGIVLNNCSSVTMGPGTEISGNTSGASGGGIWNSDSSVLVMEKVTVSGNKAAGMGGGIYASGDGSVQMSETVLSGNEAVKQGGGAAISGEASFSMERSDILNNKAAEWYGGGIYFDGKEHGLELTSGTIKGNYAHLNGGGIYMPEDSVEEILDAVIFNNVADNQGGGLWACPAGHTTILVNEGFAVFDNECRGDGEGYGTAGDDLVVQLHKEGETGHHEKAIVCTRMLGGFENHYYYDGALSNKHDTQYTDVWEVDKNVPRYKPTDREPPVDEIYKTHLNRDDSICLKNVISDEAKRWAKENAALIITENHARLRGGGIATNGALTLGMSGITLKNVSVRKEWDSSAASYCRVELHQYDRDGNDELLETVTLNEDNGWKHTFEELPVTYVHKNSNGSLRHGEYTYKVREVEHAGWRATYEQEKDGVWVIKNHRVNEVGGRKTWDDKGDSAGKRPESIIVRLHADGKEIAQQTVTADDDWTYLFEGLKMYDEGEEIVYTVTEDAVHEYSAHIDENSYDIRNEYTLGQTSVSVSKVWDDHHDRSGMRPASVKMQLMADGKDYGDAVTLSEDNKWVYTWDYLPEQKDGKDIVYTVRELTNARGYTKKVSGDMEKGFTVTNTLTKGAGTGDNNDMLPYGAAIAASLAGIAFILRRRRSGKSRQAG